MAVLSDVAAPTTVIELDEEVEGEQIGTLNYRFGKIGDPVPIKTPDADFEFDAESPPSQPLAVSERHRLIFVAHSDGFCVARTKDVMETAEKIKEKGSGPSVEELSIVDVSSVGKVSILALSAGESTLAAAVGCDLHFFSVTALLQKEQKPSLTHSLNDSSCIKVMRWSRKSGKSYVILSSNGKLFHGAGQGPLKYLTDDVDAVEWSANGNLVAIARKNVLGILSSEFKEKLSMSLSFESFLADSDANGTIKVDSIRWVRLDCMIIGCFQLTSSGEEESYIVQVITSKDKEITDASSKPIVQCFNDVFLGFTGDAFSLGSGPNMFVSYLNQCELAFIANRKNMDQHIVLFSWLMSDDNTEAAMVEILNDAWLPRIDPQGNGDDNLILGLCIDKVSHDEKVKFMLGEEEKEVSPCCVLLCVTVDGKLTMFHFASVMGDSVPLTEVSAISDEEEDISLTRPSENTELNNSGVGEHKVETDVFRWKEPEQKKFIKEIDYEVPIKENKQPAAVEKSLRAAPMLAESTLRNQELRPVAQTVKGNGQFPVVKLNEDREGRQSPIFQHRNSNIKHSSVNTFTLEGPRPVVGEFHEKDSIKPAEVKGHTGFISGKVLTNLSSQSSFRDSHKVLGKELQGKFEPASLQSASFPFQDNFASRKSSNVNFDPNKDKQRSVSSTGLSTSEPSLSKKFHNVEDMVKELDTLLECIEGPGGFKDASVALLENSVGALEEGIWTLSDRCNNLRGIMDHRLEDIQFLCDKMLQVSATKAHMEGMFRQSTDTQYWDLWNLQKLSSDLELKRKHILDLNQDLTNQLIELEIHFNTLELNKFGENGGENTNRRNSHNMRGPSRHVQSLYSLHNTMTAQLTAAEQLSECLSKQMAALSVDSPVRKQEKKRELFETIGIPYTGDSFSSPDGRKAGDALSNKKLSISSCSAASKEWVTRNQTSTMKSCEPESIRRRRDSLDQSWNSFQPLKTTVKRVLLQDSPKVASNRSTLSVNKQKNSQWMEGSDVAHSRRSSSSSIGIEDTPTKQLSGRPSNTLFRWTNELPDIAETAKPNSPSTQLLSMNSSAFSAKSAVQSTPKANQVDPRQTFNLNAERSMTSETFIQNLDPFEVNKPKTSIQQSEVKPHQTPSITKKLPALNQPATSYEFQFSPASVVDSVPSLSGKVIHSELDKGKGQNHLPGEIISSSSPSPSIFSSSSAPMSSFLKPAAPASSSTVSSGVFASKSKANVNATLPVSQSQTSKTSFSTFTPTSSSLDLISKTSKTEYQPSVAQVDSKLDKNSAAQASLLNLSLKKEENITKTTSSVQPELHNDTYSLKPELTLPSTSEPSSSSESGIQLGFVALNPKTQPTQPQFVANISSPSTFASSGTSNAVKSESLDVGLTQEDEMEEEAPETSLTSALSLGNLSGFGLGSTPVATSNKPNPFGVAFVNSGANPATSPFSMSPGSGELFQPASFNFQSQQPNQPSPATNIGGFSSGSGTSIPAPTSGFGQPAQVGLGQKALGSVLGSFGQSRQIGSGLPGTVASSSAFATGFAGNSSSGGFLTASGRGGFSGLASGGGGFGGLAASGGGGFGGLPAAGGGGGFGGMAATGGGFAAAATAPTGFAAVTAPAVFAGAASGSGFSAPGGGFGGFGNQQGSLGFSAFGSGSGGSGGRPPAELFTQMRK